jgi:hypothetical protein
MLTLHETIELGIKQMFGMDYSEHLRELFEEIIENIIQNSKGKKNHPAITEIDSIIDPNDNLDEILAISFKNQVNYMGKKHNLLFKQKEIPKNLISMAEKWIYLDLKDFFEIVFEKDYKFQKFTEQSIVKLVKKALDLLLSEIYFIYYEYDYGKIEEEDYLEQDIFPVIKYTEKARFQWIAGQIYYATDYLVNPSLLFDEENMITQYIDQRVEEIPKDQLKEEIRHKIYKFVKKVLYDVYHEEDESQIKYSLNLFLYYSYFGVIDGKIPGIKQNAYSFEELMKDMDSFIEYLEIAEKLRVMIEEDFSKVTEIIKTHLMGNRSLQNLLKQIQEGNKDKKEIIYRAIEWGGKDFIRAFRLYTGQ